VIWAAPAEAVDGRLTMLPPTLSTLRDLAGHPDVPSALSAAETRDPATPVRARFTSDPQP